MTQEKPFVLIVEDDPILRDLTRRQIAKLGFQSILLPDGEEAVAHPGDKVGLIFMDIGLPGIDGSYATMLIREKELNERRPRVPIIALTGHADRSRVLSVGMDDFLQKPALLADVKTMIDKWMRYDVL